MLKVGVYVLVVLQMILVGGMTIAAILLPIYNLFFK